MAEDNRRLKSLVRREVREVMREEPSERGGAVGEPSRVMRAQVKREPEAPRRRGAGNSPGIGRRAENDRDAGSGSAARSPTPRVRRQSPEDSGDREGAGHVLDKRRPATHVGRADRRTHPSASSGHSGGTSQSGASEKEGQSGSTLTVQQVRHLIATELQQSGMSGSPSSAQSSSSASAGAQSGSSAGNLGESSSPLSQLTAQQLQTLIQQELQSAKSPSSHQKGSQSTASGSTSGQTAAPSADPSGDKNSQAVAVAEVLTQAQWELSKELEANLKQLRQVINQSQEVARKIEQVLGRGQKGQSSGSN